MPAQKCVASNNLDDAESMESPTQQSQRRAQPTRYDKKPEQEDNDGVLVKDEGSDGSSLMGSEEKPVYLYVELPNTRKDFQCPICLGIIKKTRTVMECLHRFCRECIDKSMRMGNKECPACRTHCPSRRSLRDDPNYDALISALYPDIDKYEEEEESAFHEEDMARNELIQASISQISKRQSEAIGKGCTQGKYSAGATLTRPQRNKWNTYLRRWNTQSTELQGYEDSEDENDNNGGKYVSSSDEHTKEVRKRKYKRRHKSTKPSETSSAANADNAGTRSDVEASTQSRGISPGLLWNPDKLTWGRGGARSNTRQGSSDGCSSKKSRSNGLSKLVDYCLSSEENNDEVSLQAEEVEMGEECINPSDQATQNHQTQIENQNPVRHQEVNPANKELQLSGEGTLTGLETNDNI